MAGLTRSFSSGKIFWGLNLTGPKCAVCHNCVAIPFMALSSYYNFLAPDALVTYWSDAHIEMNVFIGLNLLGALLLGMFVGYERSYHGRAAGLRTYGLVCMASAALTIFVGYADFWYGGRGGLPAPDPSRVIQGIVSGIGFLCGGVIMKDGLSISGLTTAASLWAVAAIGVLVGVGFYGAAIAMALLSMACMSGFRSVRGVLPVRKALGVKLKFRDEVHLTEEALRNETYKLGYTLFESGLAIHGEDGHTVWRFTIVAHGKFKEAPKSELAKYFTESDNILSFSLEPSRN